MKSCILFCCILMLFIAGPENFLIAQERPGAAIIVKRLSEFKAGLDTLIFVKRFEAVETPCICIDEQDNKKAYAKRKIINSNYQVELSIRKRIDSGVRCLSQYYARYSSFKVQTIDTFTQKMEGIVELTYGYPASSVIQFLGMCQQDNENTKSYFNHLLKNTGRFTIYPEKDKYRIWMVLDSGPYNNMDTVFGYLEIVKNAVGPPSVTSYAVYFDQASYEKGDKNNQIFLKFTSTSFNLETQYYSRLLYEDLKFIQSDDMVKKANALWLKSFYNNPLCKSCRFVYEIAELMVKTSLFSLPNTNPVPAH